MRLLTENVTQASSSAHDARMQIRFSAYRELLPGICQASAAFARGTGSGDSAKLVMVLRELLYNAIEHGSKNDPEQEIGCAITRDGGSAVVVMVSDSGDGFDREAVDLHSLATPTDCRRGGLRLVNALSDFLKIENGGRTIICRVSWDTETSAADTSAQGIPESAGKEW